MNSPGFTQRLARGREGWRVVQASQKFQRDWRSAGKLSVVLGTPGLYAAKLRKYCRERGLLPEQLKL